MHVQSCDRTITGHAHPCHMRQRMQRPPRRRLQLIGKRPVQHSLLATFTPSRSSGQALNVSYSRRRAVSLHATPQEAIPSANIHQQNAGAESNGSSPADPFPDPFAAQSEASSAVPVTAAGVEASASPATVQLLPYTPRVPGPDEQDLAALAQASESYMGLGELADVEELRGCRVNVDSNGKAIIEYLVNWKVCP